MTKKAAIVLMIAGLFVGGLVGAYLALPTLAERAAVSISKRIGSRIGHDVSWDSFHFERHHRIEFTGVSLQPKGDSVEGHRTW